VEEDQGIVNAGVTEGKDQAGFALLEGVVLGLEPIEVGNLDPIEFATTQQQR